MEKLMQPVVLVVERMTGRSRYFVASMVPSPQAQPLTPNELFVQWWRQGHLPTTKSEAVGSLHEAVEKALQYRDEWARQMGDFGRNR